MNKKIFGFITIWAMLVLVIMSAFHFPIVKRSLYETAIVAVETSGHELTQELKLNLRELEMDIESMSLSLDTRDQWLDDSIRLLKDRLEVLEVHYYDAERVHKKAQGQQGHHMLLDQYSIEGLFFYQPLIVEPYDSTKNLVSYKGENHYLVMVIDMSKLLSKNMKGSKGMQGIYDQHIVPIIEVGEQLNGRMFFNHSEAEKTVSGYVNEVFYNTGEVTFGNITYHTLTLQLDQNYQQSVRLYVIRLLIIAGVLLIMGFLVAWRIIKTFQKEMVGQTLGRVPELKEIRKNISLAIEHMNVAVKSYDDIGILKEELEELYSELEEEGVQNERTQKNHK